MYCRFSFLRPKTGGVYETKYADGGSVVKKL